MNEIETDRSSITITDEDGDTFSLANDPVRDTMGRDSDRFLMESGSAQRGDTTAVYLTPNALRALHDWTAARLDELGLL